MPAQLTLIIGNKGSGKSLLTCVLAQLSHEMDPKIPQVGNVHIKNVTYYEDIHKFFTMKLARHDLHWLEAYVDEAAYQGIEARGSFREERAIPTYLYALSRKVNINCWLVTQLMSMIDKRVQWIGDWLILCEAKPSSDRPKYFLYSVYDPNNKKRHQFRIFYKDALRRVFIPQLYRTDEIPFEDTLIDGLMEHYEVSPQDLKEFDNIMGIKA